MYVTAHHIRSPRGEEETQSFFHRHDAQSPWPADPAQVPTTQPGRLVDSWGTLRPGGNAVLSYLDVYSEREPSFSELQAALQALSVEGWDPAAGPLRTCAGTIHIQLGLNLGVTAPEEVLEEAAELRESVLHMARRHLPDAQAA